MSQANAAPTSTATATVTVTATTTAGTHQNVGGRVASASGLSPHTGPDQRT
jgi:hypothetical protein